MKSLYIKGLCLMTMALLFSVNPAAAQMTDEALIAYIKEGTASGKDHMALARELSGRGVSMAQLERVRTSLNSAEGASTTAVIDDRTRETVEETPAAFTVQAPEDTLKIYGRDIFRNHELTFTPNQNMATPENYRLGPGDEVIIDIWGANETSIRQTISPEGCIRITSLGLVNLNGMTVAEADRYLRRQLGRIYSIDGENAQSDIKLSLGNTRTINVNILGDVTAPGTYQLSSFSSIFHALYLAGGVNILGNLRKIELVRNGRKVTEIDIYDLLQNGGTTKDVNLQDNDFIIVKPYEILVEITGNVKRPMFYEMKGGETAGDLISYAGGFTADAYRDDISVTRKDGREFKLYTLSEKDIESFRIEDGDLISVGSILDRFANRIEIKGAVFRPGTYELGTDIRTLKDLIRKADGLTESAFTDRAILYREKEDLTLETRSIDLTSIMNGRIKDMELRKNDVLFIADGNNLERIGTITVEGEVLNPGEFPFSEHTGIEDAILQAGGLTDAASTAKVDVSRRLMDKNATSSSETLCESFTFTIDKDFKISGGNRFTLEPYDHIYVRRSPGYTQQRHVNIEGEVAYPGRYPITKRNFRLSDLISQCGGATEWAYLKGARLSRTLSTDEVKKAEEAMGLLENTRDSISMDDIITDRRFSVGIDLEKAIESPGGDADVVLKEGDILEIPEYTNTVKISGNVMYPNTVTYRKGITVGDYVNMAGGYGFRSKKSKAYIVYANGTVNIARKNASDIVQPGCEIIVPRKEDNPEGFQKIMSIATTSASMATMIATIGNIIMRGSK